MTAIYLRQFYYGGPWSTNDMHARPIVIMSAPEKDDTLALVLYRNQLIGRFQGQEKILIEMG